MNSEPNTSQDHVSNIHTRWQKSELKLCKKFSRTRLVLKTNEEISTYHFFNLIMKNHHQRSRNTPRISWKKLQKFSIKLKHARGSNSKKDGAISKQFQETEKQPEGLMLPGPYPRFLMDPDLHNASEALD